MPRISKEEIQELRAEFLQYKVEDVSKQLSTYGQVDLATDTVSVSDTDAKAPGWSETQFTMDLFAASIFLESEKEGISGELRDRNLGFLLANKELLDERIEKLDQWINTFLEDTKVITDTLPTYISFSTLHGNTLKQLLRLVVELKEVREKYFGNKKVATAS